jgi:hypothetical protein
MPDRTLNWNPWKLIAIGMAVLFATALITGVVVAHYAGANGDATQNDVASSTSSPSSGNQNGQPALVANAEPASRAPTNGGRVSAAAPAAPVPRVAARPLAADVEACNEYARTARNSTSETLKDALVGGAAGAGLGAASGAIAGGGSGAGKGAGIGALVGATAGTLFGLNRADQSDVHAAQAYRACMKRRGYD